MALFDKVEQHLREFIDLARLNSHQQEFELNSLGCAAVELQTPIQVGLSRWKVSTQAGCASSKQKYFGIPRPDSQTQGQPITCLVESFGFECCFGCPPLVNSISPKPTTQHRSENKQQKAGSYWVPARRMPGSEW
jgi:hypothetical protein